MQDLFSRALTAIIYVSVFAVVALLCLGAIKLAWWLFMAAATL